MSNCGRKAIFISGAASGIGRATARLFAARGWLVGAYDINGVGLARLREELGPEACVGGALDVCDRVAYSAAPAAFAKASGGRLDILFNNAGIGTAGYFDEQEFQDILAVVNVNLVGVLNGIHLAVPLLRASPNALCFTTSSSAATFGMPGIAVYSATKHAVRGLTEALSIELARHGIRVADALPGLIDTPMLPPQVRAEAPHEGMFRLVPPEMVAQAVWAAYHDEQARLHWFVPEEIGELDQASALDPEGTRARLSAQQVVTAMTQATDDVPD